MGVKISKRYSWYKSKRYVFKLVLNVSPMARSKLPWGFLKFEFPLFTFFSKISNHYLYPMEKAKTSIIFKTTETERTLVLSGSNYTYMGYIWPCIFQDLLGSFGALAIFFRK